MKKTDEWELYQKGVEYNNKISLYSKTEMYHDFYNGDQWRGVKSNGLPKFVFNMCKSAINYFVAFICSQNLKIQYTCDNVADVPDNPEDMMKQEFALLMTNMASQKWEKDKLDQLIRRAMLDGAITGDFCAYVYWDATKETGQYEKGDFCTELVDGINVLFGNPNNVNVEKQPYILVVGRDTVISLVEEAKKNRVSEADIKNIVGDNSTEYQAGQKGKTEIENSKCNYIIKFYKKNGVVHWIKSTKYCTIIKEVSLGIKKYPVVWGNWEGIKNSYHGMSAIEGIIDNQIGINQLFSMVSYWMKMMAFGKVVYDSSRIKSWSNQIGTAIAVDGDVSGAMQQLSAGNFQGAVLTVIDMAIAYTKEFIGSSDSLMGNVDPERASGTAIIATSKQAAMPLGNIVAARNQFVEDLGLVWAEFFQKKYWQRDVLIDNNGEKVKASYSAEGMHDTLVNCKVDVGASSLWSEITSIQALDNLLAQGHITKLQYFERIQSMNIIPNVQGLIDDAKEQMPQDFEKMAQFIDSLPPEEQAQIKSLPPEEMEQKVKELMK